MVYRRRRYYKRRSRTLRKGNIFSRRSAKSQAKQIYALKKRVSAIQRRTAPEIITQIREISPVSFTQNTIGQIMFPTEASIERAGIFPVVAHTGNPVTGSAAGINNFQRSIALKIYGRINFSYTQNVDHSQYPAWLRLVICQTAKARAAEVSTADVFTPGLNGTSYFSAVMGPLQPGLARTCRVLRDKRYKLDSQHPAYSIRFSIKRLYNFYEDTVSSSDSSSSSNAYPAGSVYILYAYYSPSGTALFPPAALDLMYKLLYTDA